MKGDTKRKMTVALAGNPNVGKSTLFNALTGLHQHTGNWPGKTVGVARGHCKAENTVFSFVDLPGTYSLTGQSEDERVAAEYIASGSADCTVVVCDGSSLERSLILALQILSRTDKVVVCVNLMDEAQRSGIFVDAKALSEELGVAVVLTSAGKKKGLDRLLSAIENVQPHPVKEYADPVAAAEQIAAKCIRMLPSKAAQRQQKADEILLSKCFGIPILLFLLFFIVWLTVWGANYPSQLLSDLFDRGYALLKSLLQGLPPWLGGILADGMYATSARVICVMLPPMAIFFPLFTLLEDVGYLPRMAFLLDGGMQRCGGCGKQALTLCMGLGCNAVGVTGSRIIESPRERLLAILTNAMVPCNGRFPALVLLGSMCFSGGGAAFAVALCVVLGVLGAMAACGILSKTALRHKSSAFVMELPPFRLPRFGQVLVRSVLDRTLQISGRALIVAAPAGALLWLLANTHALEKVAAFLQPVGLLMGMNGAILLGFVFCLPANELLIPVILMVLTGAGSLQSVSDGLDLCFGISTAVCTMVFTVFHWPCATTLMTVYRETKSMKKTAVAFALPTAVGVILCIMLNLVLKAFV